MAVSYAFRETIFLSELKPSEARFISFKVAEATSRLAKTSAILWLPVEFRCRLLKVRGSSLPENSF